MSGIIWQSLVAVGASVVGWSLAMIGQAVQARRENNREHYYKVLERTEDIFARCSALSDSVYDFHQKSVKLALVSSSDDSILTDFITRFQSQLASIYLSQRIFYPGLKIDPAPISRMADDLADEVREMWTIAAQRGALGDTEFSRQAQLNQIKRETIIKALGNELGVIMNVMSLSLNKTAAKLRIQAEPVSVDRSKMPDPTPRRTP